MLSDRSYGAARAVLMLAACGMAATASGQAVTFTDRTSAVGLAVTHYFDSQDVAPSYMDAGVCVGDFNRDGWMDLFVLSGGGDAGGDHLYINNGNGTFTDQAAAWGVNAVHVGGGCTVGDYDGDGWDDIFVTSYGANGSHGQIGKHKLYRNNGNGTFSEMAVACGVNFSSHTSSDAFGIAFGDYDLDGREDICLGSWVDHVAGTRLYHNNGDGTFTDVTGVAITFAPPTYGFSPRFVDMDGDRYPELLLAADFGTSKYFHNNGDGTFTDVTAPAHTSKESNGMGQTVIDFDHDGKLDWYVTSIHHPTFFPQFPGNQLYLNQGNNVYNEVGIASGVMPGGWGWGTVAVDLNHDGWPDIVETNGWDNPPWMTVGSKVFVNNRDGTFNQIAPDCGLDHLGGGRGLVRIDFDNDGDQDIVLASNGRPLRFFRNDLVHGPDTGWLRIFLDTTATPYLASRGLGSKVRVTTPAFTQTSYIDGGSNYVSSSEQSAHFGVGSATTADVRIEWNNGRVSTRAGVSVNQTMTIKFCPADFNDDGQVDFSDYLEFLNHYDGQDELADMNRDGQVDFSDYLEFLNHYDSGC